MQHARGQPGTQCMTSKQALLAALQSTGDGPDYSAIAESLQGHMTEMHYEPGQDVFEVSRFIAPMFLIFRPTSRLL